LDYTLYKEFLINDLGAGFFDYFVCVLNDENKNTLVSVTWGKKESYGFFSISKALKINLKTSKNKKVIMTGIIAVRDDIVVGVCVQFYKVNIFLLQEKVSANNLSSV